VIDVPGYRVLRPIGRGGMATVYLAIQESVQREVALKVLSSTLAGEDEFGERFLREARIAAKLRHPHVVAVHDVGRCGDVHYMAMELLPGGPVLRRGESGGDEAYALRVTREIADALDYAHARGVVHRDIKPDNILLREDGAAVLTDFGIARANDAVRMTRTGAIVGTPQYMSPEQARGKPLDGRADLYSLGIVLHELLTGRAPFQAEDPVAVGIQHITAPRPRLPAELERLQPLLDRLLATAPERRFQSGREVVAAVAALQGESLPVAKSLPPRASTPTRLSPPPDPLRAEPRIEGWEGIALAARRDGPRRPLQRSRRWPWLAAVLLVALGAGLWLEQERLRDWLPQTHMARLAEEAEDALRTGQLDLAASRYRAMLAMDPESARGREGLRRIGERALHEAEAAAAQGREPEARALLGLARELDLPQARLQRVEALLLPSQPADEIEPALLRARAAFEQGRLSGASDSAAALYLSVLERQPEHSLARRGLADVQAALLAQGEARLREDNLAAVRALLSEVESIDPAHPGLPPLRAALADRENAQQARIDAQLREARMALERGRLIEGGDSARERFRTLLAEVPGHPEAERGLREVAGALLRQAERRAADFEFDAAWRLLAEVEATEPRLPALAAARARLEQSEAARQAQASAVAIGPELRARLDGMLAEAQQAADAGNLLAPPGASAYDLYRAVLAQEPGNVRAREGMAALPAQARQRFEQALGARRLSQATAYLEGLNTLDPDDAFLPSARRRLAGAYLGLAIERLEGGQVRAASEAVEAARGLDPNHPDLAAVRARVEQGGG
jgi:serine/threonine-protein kinase PpkA